MIVKTSQMFVASSRNCFYHPRYRQQGAVTRAVYLPPGCRWYEVSHLLTRATWQEQEAGQVTVAAPLDTLPLHLRGVHILPLQQPASNTATSRTNPLELLGNIIELRTNHLEVSSCIIREMA